MRLKVRAMLVGTRTLVPASYHENMFNWLFKTVYNLAYRLKPPPMVSYWSRADSAKAKVFVDKDGAYKMQIDGEKKTYPGFPRGHILTGKLAEIKHSIKNRVFNQVFNELAEKMEDGRFDMLPPEKMVPAVRHIWETFERLEHCEIVPDMKARIVLIKKVICWFLSEDDAYRMRAQLFLDLIDQKKVRLSEDDLYYARGKYWKPDLYKKVFGKVMEGFQY